MPPTPPIVASTRLSTSNCRAIRLDAAPMAERTANSRTRDWECARSRLPRFAQAMSITAATAAASSRSIGRTGPTIVSRSGTACSVRLVLVLGYSTARPRANAASSVFARSSVTPGRRRAIALSCITTRSRRNEIRESRAGARCRNPPTGRLPPDTRTRVAAAHRRSFSACRRSSCDCPITSRWPAKCDAQNACVRITGDGPVSRYSSGWNSRPSAGRSASVSPNPGPASTAPRRSGSAPTCAGDRPRVVEA